MESRTETIKKIKEQYPFLSKQYGIRHIGIFGSVATDSAKPDSDVDIVVEFEHPKG